MSFVPMLMFAILFGLSMDYEVFLHQPGAGAVPGHRGRHRASRGIGATARVITTAAAIMVTVFTAFVLSDDPTVKMFGGRLAGRCSSTPRSSGMIPGAGPQLSLLGEKSRAWSWFPLVAPTPPCRTSTSTAARHRRSGQIDRF